MKKIIILVTCVSMICMSYMATATAIHFWGTLGDHDDEAGDYNCEGLHGFTPIGKSHSDTSIDIPITSSTVPKDKDFPIDVWAQVKCKTTGCNRTVYVHGTETVRITANDFNTWYSGTGTEQAKAGLAGAWCETQGQTACRFKVNESGQ